MRFMLVLTYDEAAAAGRPPEPEIFEEMGRFNQAMVDAGVLLAGEGLAPSSQGAIVAFGEGDGEEPTVTDGPFTEIKELIGGFWILRVDSLDEAVGWARRAPFRHGERVQIRRVFDPEDFAGVAPDEVMEAEERMRTQVADQHGS
ncbi:YciI family protein [Actinomycetospora soli]|uniref:YciI family protein n=1 Tax=Actinomycetospora soli TaxID=2893887 RepID=UPI001E64E535|nr:YciI family protein [Actinomycetospora soli]MCD2190928.1 YciI family protein [Actinomycetospora soli]